MNEAEREPQFFSDHAKENWVHDNLNEKIKSIRNWIIGPGEKLLSSQNAKPYNFEEALSLRKAHEQFEFKCMKALEDFATLCEYRKQNISLPALNDLDYMVQNYVDRLNKRTFFVVSCYTYFHLVEELWKLLENLQKQSKEVNNYKLNSIKQAIDDLELGMEKCKLRLNHIAHELDRLRVILTSSDQTYLEQLEKSFDDTCRTVSERLQEMRIRKLILKKQSKLLECEDNVYESIGWTEELNENIELLYQENCIGKNQMEAEEILIKCSDIYKQAQTTYAYCDQLLETYTKLCDADNRKLPRNIVLSKNRLLRLWPRLESRILEFQQRAEASEDIHSRVDELLTRVQEYLLEAARSPIAFDRVCGSPSVCESVPVPNEPQREQLSAIKKEFQQAKSLGIALIERIPKGLFADDPIFVGPAMEEVIRLIRLKLYTLWLKIREYEYLIMGHNSADQTTASELGMDTMHPIARSRSTNSTFRRPGSPYDDVEDYPHTAFHSPRAYETPRSKRSPRDANSSLFIPHSSEMLVASNDSPEMRETRIRSPRPALSRQATTGSIHSEGGKPLWTGHLMDSKSLEGQDKFPAHRSAFRNPKSTVESNDYLQNPQRASNYESRPQTVKREPHGESYGPHAYLNQTNKPDEPVREYRQVQVGQTIPDYGSDPNRTKMDTVGKSGSLGKQRTRQPESVRKSSTDSVGPVPLGVRLKELKSDLEECRSRLYDLVNATCLSTSQNAAKMKKDDRQPGDWRLVVSTQDIDRISMIFEETSGMSGTTAAQEKFISSLLDQVTREPHLELEKPVQDVKDTWATYQRHLAIFFDFIGLLQKGYKLLPRIGEYREKQTNYVTRTKQPIAVLSKCQEEGDNLDQEIAELVETDLVYSSAEKLSTELKVRPKLNWLMNLLRRNRRMVKDSLEELDLILANLRADSSMETVDLGALLPLSPTTPNGNRDTFDHLHARERSQGVAHSASTGTLTRPIAGSKTPTWGDRSPTSAFATDISPPIPPRSSLPRAPSAVSAPLYTERVDMKANEFTYRPASRDLVTEPITRQPWRFTEHLADVVCQSEDDVTFCCKFVGPSSPSEVDVHWTFRPVLHMEGKLAYGHKEFIPKGQNDVIEEASMTHAKLTLKRVEVTRAGLYTVRITNPRINTTMKSSATLQIKPTIVKEIGDVVVKVLDSEIGLLAPIALTVNYKGFVTVPNVTWKFGGKPVDPKLWQVRADLLESSIFSNVAHVFDRGSYECQLKDSQTGIELHSFGTLQIESARTTPTRTPLIVGNNPSTGFVREGEKLTLHCPLDPAIQLSDCTIDWLHNGNVIYTFNPARRSVISPTFPIGQGTAGKDNQFQRGQTIWRTYVADETCALATNTTHRSDQGIYTCRINSQGKAYESEGEVTILTDLTFSQPLREMSIQTGQPVTLFCQVMLSVDNGSTRSANQPEMEALRVQWFWNDELLNPYKCLRMGVQLHSVAGRLSLTIQRASRAHAGRYRCEVARNEATISTECNLEVHESMAPVVVNAKVEPSEDLCVDQAARIIVNYTAQPPPDCLWIKDGEPLALDTGLYQVQTMENQCSLNISKVRPEHTGIYQLRLTNEIGTTEASAVVRVIPSRSLTSELQIQPHAEKFAGLLAEQTVTPRTTTDAPPTNLFLLEPSNVKARSGQSAFLFCILQNPSEPVAVHWFRNGARIDPVQEPKFRLHTNHPRPHFHQLEIMNATRDLAGSYKVKVTGAGEEKRILGESSCWLIVDDPKDVNQKASVFAPQAIDNGFSPILNVNPGEPFELTCNVTGSPTPSFCWIKDGSIVIPCTEENIEISGLDSIYQLSVKEAKPIHSGEWTLVCYNPYGTVAISSTVLVSSTVNHMKVFSPGDPTNGRAEVTDRSSDKLPPPPTQKELEYGLHAASADLSPNNSKRIHSPPSLMEPPEFKSVFTDVACRIGETVRLQCVISGCPTPAVHWTVNGRPGDKDDPRRRLISHGDAYTLIIKQTVLSDSGRYALTAENIIGVATCSALLVVCVNPVSRPTSALSEPGLFTMSPDEQGMTYYLDGRQRRHSGTQTPTNQRVAIIRSVSMSPFEMRSRDRPLLPSKHPVRCRHCSHVYDADYDYEPMEFSSGWHGSTKRKRHTHRRSRRVRTNDNFLIRNQSEGSLVHRCPVCHTIITPVSTLSEPRLGCVHSTRVTERVIRYEPTESQPTQSTSALDPTLTRKFQTDSKHRHPQPSESTSYETVQTPVLRARARRQSAQLGTERHIPIRVVNTTPTTRIKTHVIREYSVPTSPTKLEVPDIPESQFSVVESSDGEGNP